MKVLQVNCVYDYGSTGHLVADLHHNLSSIGVQSIVCYGRGKRVHGRDLYKVSTELYSKFQNALSRFTGLMYGGCILSTEFLKRIIVRENPDIVHIQCINGYFVNIYSLINWLKRRSIRTIITLHAEFMYTANCSHALDCERWKKGCGDCPRLKRETHSFFFDRTHQSWSKMYDAFADFKECTIVSVSPWVKSRALLSPILNKCENRVIYNGINTDIFKMYDAGPIKNQYGIKEDKIVLHVTPYFTESDSSIKGGKYVVQLAQQMLDESVMFLVVGNYKSGLSLPPNIKMLGYISNQVELAKLYSIADVTLLTSKRETFSMVTAESLCCGTPVVGFLSGGPEQIAIKKYSQFVPFGDVTQLCQNIKKMIELKEKRIEISIEAKTEYSTDTMFNSYYKLYNEMANGAR